MRAYLPKRAIKLAREFCSPSGQCGKVVRDFLIFVASRPGVSVAVFTAPHSGSQRTARSQACTCSWVVTATAKGQFASGAGPKR